MEGIFGVRIKLFLKRTVYAASTLVLVLTALPMQPVSAAQVTSRKLTLSSSAPSPATSSYTFVFTAISATTIKSVNIDLCDSASGTCSPAGTGGPSGLTSTSAAVGTVSNIGSGGSWTGTFTTNGRLRIANGSNTGSPSAGISIAITGITNPTAANTTFYARITTYSDAAWTTPLDTGTVAASTATQITVNASVDETLTFCTGTSGITSSSCASATGSTVTLGSITPSTTGSGTSQIGISTNGGSGYSITVNGTTLTSGANTIAALASQTGSSQGNSQFGINLKANTTPVIGSDPAGTGSGAPSANYGTTNQYRFVTGDPVASVGAADNFRLYTVSYIANVAGSTPAGNYTTNLQYIATATF